MRFYEIKKSHFQLVTSTDDISFKKTDGMSHCYVFNGNSEQAKAIYEKRLQYSALFTLYLGMMQAYSEEDAVVRFALAAGLSAKGISFPCSDVLFVPKAGPSADENKSGQESVKSSDNGGTASALSLK